MNAIDINRHNHLIDPALHIWGWEIPAYLFLGGMTAGVMIVSAIAGKRTPIDQQSKWMRWMPFAAPLLLSIGMLALFLDLEYKLHVFRFYTAFRITSPMSWGAWVLLGIYPVTLMLGLAQLHHREVERLPEVLRRLANVARETVSGLRRASIVLGLALGAYTGILLGTLGARAVWSSALLGPLFLASGLSTGAALVMLFSITHEEHTLVRRIDVAAIGIEILLIGLYFADLASSGSRGAAAVKLFFGGPYTATFWSLVVVAGLAVPAALELFETRFHSRPTRVAPVLLLFGGLSLRWLLVAAGQSI